MARSIYRKKRHVTELTVARGESDSSSRTSINAAAAIRHRHQHRQRELSIAPIFVIAWSTATGTTIYEERE
jgi:hypothetical protein